VNPDVKDPMTRSSARAALQAIAVIGLIAVMNCAEGDKIPTIPPVTAANIAIVSGSGQTGVVTLGLTNPLVVKVTDVGGQPVAGFQVLWTVSSGGGSLPVATTTGASGTASESWILGSQTGSVTATAGNSALTGATKSVTFTATAIGASAALESGSGQSGFAGDRLGSDFVVRLTDDLGVPVGGKTVTWRVISGNGTVSPTTSLSFGDGLASTRYTLGPTAGIQSVEAVATGFTSSPISFLAQAEQRPLGALVSVRDNFFTPAPATVPNGSRVVWNWEGNNVHNVTWINEPAGNSDSGTQQSGVHEVVFLSNGTFAYYCTIHGSPTGGMRGSVVVN
jgi:adhesin/invasin